MICEGRWAVQVSDLAGFLLPWCFFHNSSSAVSTSRLPYGLRPCRWCRLMSWSGITWEHKSLNLKKPLHWWRSCFSILAEISGCRWFSISMQGAVWSLVCGRTLWCLELRRRNGSVSSSEVEERSAVGNWYQFHYVSKSCVHSVCACFEMF